MLPLTAVVQLKVVPDVLLGLVMLIEVAVPEQMDWLGAATSGMAFTVTALVACEVLLQQPEAVELWARR